MIWRFTIHHGCDRGRGGIVKLNCHYWSCFKLSICFFKFDALVSFEGLPWRKNLSRLGVDHLFFNFFMMSWLAEIAQLGERQTEDLKVPGSNPESSHELWIIPGLGIEFFSFLFFLFSRCQGMSCFSFRFLNNHFQSQKNFSRQFHNKHEGLCSSHRLFAEFAVFYGFRG